MLKKLLPLLFLSFQLCASVITLSNEQAEKIALRIWKNECGGKVEGLTTWNKGEEFASLGIGHFIWYPKEYQGIFDEQFPQFLLFCKKKGIAMPLWLSLIEECPWKTREEFLENFYSERLVELRSWLEKNLAIQTHYILQRFDTALPKMQNTLNEIESKHLTTVFHALSKEPNGPFILIDYLNFKGDGTSTKERYKDKGWGLLQVLLDMPLVTPSYTESFIDSARTILKTRVENSPAERNEMRWLKGWINRVENYRVEK